MKKMLSVTIVLMMILSIFPLSVPQVNGQPSGWIRLTTHPHGDHSPDYSPDGGKIAFIRTQSDQWHRDIWIMNADGSDQELLVEGPPGGLGWPDWSPDGTKIVYTKYYNDFRTDIMIIDVNTKEVTAVVEDWAPNHHPKWSPDGSRILFTHEVDHSNGYWNLFVINADGTGLSQITYGSYHRGYPEWSPDGSKIAFGQCVRGHPSACEYDIYVVNADGSSEVRLVDNGSRPVFFPDRERILFWRDSNLFSVNIDGANVEQLTDCPADMQIGKGHIISSDGAEIAFAAKFIYEYPNIYKIIVAPSEQLTTDLDTDRNPVALRDNTGNIWVFFESNRAGGNPWGMWYKTSDDNGNTWSLPHLLTTSMYSNAPFSESGIGLIQDTDGRMWLVFSTSKTPGGGDNEVWFITSDDGGNTWSDPQKPYEGTASWPGYGSPTIVEAFGKIWIFFMHLEGFKYVATDDGGLTWSSPAYFGNIAGKDAFHPHAMRDVSGNLWLFYERQPAPHTEYARNISYVRSNDGVTWSQPRNTEEMSPGPKRYPWPVQDSSGRFTVFFDVPVDGVEGSEIFYVTGDDDGATWSDPEPFTEDPNQDWDPTAISTDNGLLVFWVSNRSGNWDVWYEIFMRTPSAPLDLVAYPRVSSVELHWDPPSYVGDSIIENYKIYRGTSSGSKTFLASVDGNTLNYLDTSVSVDVIYYYYVTAINSFGESEPSNEVRNASKESIKGVETVATLNEATTTAIGRDIFSIQQNFYVKQGNTEIYWVQNIIYLCMHASITDRVLILGEMEIFDATVIPHEPVAYSPGLDLLTSIGAPSGLKTLPVTVELLSTIEDNVLNMANDCWSFEFDLPDGAYISTEWVGGRCHIPETVIVGWSSALSPIANFDDPTDGYMNTYVRIGLDTWFQGKNEVVPFGGATTAEKSTGLEWSTDGIFEYQPGSSGQGLRFLPDYYEPIVYPPSPSVSDIEREALIISLSCPANLSLFDSQGRHLGYNQITGEIDSQIPWAFHMAYSDCEFIVVYYPNDTYNLNVIGVGDGEYTLGIDFMNKTGIVSTMWNDTGTILVGTSLSYTISIAETGEVTVTEEGPAPFPWWVLGALIVVMLGVGATLVLWKRRKTKSLEIGQTEVLTEQSGASWALLTLIYHRSLSVFQVLSRCNV